MTEIAIEIKVDVRLKGKGAQVSDDLQAHIGSHLRQIGEDLTDGTFAGYNKKYFPNLAKMYEVEFAPRDNEMRAKPDSNECTLNAKLTFDIGRQLGRIATNSTGIGELNAASAIMQHVIGIICGDGFKRHGHDHDTAENVEFTIMHVDTTSLRPLIVQNTVGPVWKRADIIEKFELDHIVYQSKKIQLPLLGYNVKPRVSLSADQFRELSVNVLRSGFNIVEPDTRNQQIFDDDYWNSYLSIAKQAINITDDYGKRRFGLNVSAPFPLMKERILEFFALHKDVEKNDEPLWVLKVDGGLDGIQNILSIRRFCRDSKIPQPVITCYPLLRHALTDLGDSRLYAEFLSLAGANIIYIGGAPRLRKDKAGHIDYENYDRGVKNYNQFIENFEAIPTIAGGIYPGAMPKYIDLFGGNVSFYVGGGVSTHLNGPVVHTTFPTKNERVRKNPNNKKEQIGGAELCKLVCLEGARAKATDDWSRLNKMFNGIWEHYVEVTDEVGRRESFDLVPRSFGETG